MPTQDTEIFVVTNKVASFCYHDKKLTHVQA